MVKNAQPRTCIPSYLSPSLPDDAILRRAPEVQHSSSTSFPISLLPSCHAAETHFQPCAEADRHRQ